VSADPTTLGRRVFLFATLGAGASLVIGCAAEPPVAPAVPGPASALPPSPVPPPAPFAPNAFIRIAPDGVVTVVVDKTEMGQGISTAHAMLVAEELEVPLSQIRTEFAPVDPAYKNILFGSQATGGSSSTRADYALMRKAGAAARMMLVTAAAQTWGVDEASCHAEQGQVVHGPTGRKLGYGDLAAKAASVPVPQDPALKDPGTFRLLGTAAPRIDAADKAAGRAMFGIDVVRPQMLIAVVARSRVFGAKLVSFDATKALTVPGVKKIFQIPSGVAVIAGGYYAARKAADLVQAKWDPGPNATQSSARILEQAIEVARQQGEIVEHLGDAEKALKAAGRTALEAVYIVPYQPHATMEPMNCTAQVGTDGCDVWAPTQFPEEAQKSAASVTGLPLGSIRIHSTLCGGGFGRRFEQDYILESVQIAKEAGGVPVKLVWSREDDMSHDFYRPWTYNAMRGALGKDGLPIAWSHRIVGPSIMSRVFPSEVKDGVDESSIEGAVQLPYAIPNVLVDWNHVETGVPVGFWRSVGNSQNAYVRECFLDELAAAGKTDPLALRKRLMTKAPRLAQALDLAATKGDWGKPMGPRTGRGIACASSFGSHVAQTAEVEVGADGAVRVKRVVCAISCGPVVNRDLVAAQMEGGIVYGLTAALKSEITIDGGATVQTNFDDFHLLRIDEMPRVEVHIVPSTDEVGGVGEPGTPPIAPAVVNAIFAATGKRVRRLPVRAADLKT
jgi:isoquinoline 1-oxidoreductase subunit beta